MSRLEIDNIQVSASIGWLEMTNVLLPFDLFNISLPQLGINQVEIPIMEIV